MPGDGWRRPAYTLIGTREEILSDPKEHVTYRLYERVGVVTLNRPEALNALTLPMIDDVRRQVLAAERDPAVVCIAITGTGRAFSAGLDMAALTASTRGDSGWAERKAAHPDELPALFSFLLQVSKPVISAVNGVTAGGGLVLALMSDLRFAAEEAAFTTVFAKRGLIAEHLMSWLLPRQIGTSRALDLLWSARKVEAAEALRVGLVDRVLPQAQLMNAVVDYASSLAESVSPRALAVIKAQVYADLSAGMQQAAAVADRFAAEALAHPDAAEGARAFVERRAPKFQPWKGDKR
jgi:enoyl-CoA hydratase/carnithine racemase